jgi:predicted house-cleaning noncanonical NTP pyrophosphatase (MazG superfamily)
VRSNARDEGLSDRGALLSERADSSVDGVLLAGERVFEHALSATVSLQLGLLVQQFHNRRVYGHLSNERRLAEEARHWFCEAWEGESTEIRRFRVEKVAPAPEGPLACTTRAGLFSTLRQVAALFYRKSERRHLEWVWDGARIWIVQCDPDVPQVGISPYGVVATLSSTAIDSVKLRLFRRFNEKDAARWQKLESVRSFGQCGLPIGNVFVLCGQRVVTSLARGGVPRGLEDDLFEMTKTSLVIRTDVGGSLTVLSSRTDEVRDAGRAVAFLQRASMEFVTNGGRASELCFIAHRFIPALSCAFSLATPKHDRVRIDSLWGLPDGLIFYPHDSFEVHTRLGAIQRRIRYKPVFFASSANGDWGQQRVAAPWDWLPSLDDVSLREVARLSRVIAKQTGRTVQIMWFTGVSPESGYPSILPWRLLFEDTPAQLKSAIATRFRGLPLEIRNQDDIRRLDGGERVRAVHIQPDRERLRDERFLTVLGERTRSLGIPIVLEGSPLSHAYYVLTRAGAAVRCVDPLFAKEVSQTFGKLVRDKIPIRIQSHGEQARVLEVHGDDLRDVLKAKLVEESLEVFWARDSDTMIAEMADTLEVLRALAAALGRSMKDVHQEARSKRQAAGSFERGLVLIETKDTPLIQVEHNEPGSKRQTKRRRRPPTIAVRQPHLDGTQVMVPLVPPLASETHGATLVSLPGTGITLSVTYGAKGVRITAIQPRHVVSTDQLSLFSE